MEDGESVYSGVEPGLMMRDPKNYSDSWGLVFIYVGEAEFWGVGVGHRSCLAENIFWDSSSKFPPVSLRKVLICDIMRP